MKVVILCGGKGTRAYPHTKDVPKALLQIEGIPIVEHVMRLYAWHGYTEFILSCGYLMKPIVEYVAGLNSDWKIECVDTGEDADTGDRIWRLRDQLQGPFHATYCDGLGDVDLESLVAYHNSHGDLATVTTVPLRSQYGILHPDGDGRVMRFEEKPTLTGYWINGGFFVFNPEVFDHWTGPNLERDVMPELARQNTLRMYRHPGFWRSMDTHKDQQELDALWRPFAEFYAEHRLGAPT